MKHLIRLISLILLIALAVPSLSMATYDGQGVGEKDSPTFVTTDLTGVTDGNIPYMQAAGAGFGDSPLSTDGTDVTNSGDMTIQGGDLAVGVSATEPGDIVLHDAGTIVLHDDGNNTNVAIGPVADGTTTLGVTGALDVSGSVAAGTMTVGSGSIVDSSGAISFGDENLTTTGTSTAGATTSNGVLTVKPDGTNEVLQVNDGTIDFTDGNAGTAGTMTVDASGNLSHAKSITAVALTEGANAVPNATDPLSFFAATTSAQLAGVLSDETGTLKSVFSDSPIFTTKITTPAITAPAASLVIKPTTDATTAIQVQDKDGNAIVTVDTVGNKAIVAGPVITATTTLSAAGPTDNLDVSGVNTVLVNTSANSVTLGGLVGGVAGQQLRVVIVNATNNTTLENAEGTGNQDIYLEGAADETKTATYGGWILECNGTHWYQTGGGGGGGAFDSTTVDSTTWSDGANATNVWTFDVSGTDTTFTFGSGQATYSGVLIDTHYETIYIPAASMSPTSTSGAVLGSYEYATNDIQVDYLGFNGTTEQYATFMMPFPAGWDRSTVKVKFYWTSATGSTAGDTVEWEIAGGALSDDDAIDAALGTAQVVSDVLLADSGADMQTSGATPALTVGGTPALGDMLVWKVSRNVGGTDDMTEDGWLFGALIQYKVTNAEAAW